MRFQGNCLSCARIEFSALAEPDAFAKFVTIGFSPRRHYETNVCTSKPAGASACTVLYMLTCDLLSLY
jgi:hypothetical protein